MTSRQPQTPPLSTHDFRSYYEALHGHTPFHWQQQLASQVCEGQWPDDIKLPTSSGKTSVIDIAVFALACQACEDNRLDGVLTAARRIFFIVDRRIIVNEAYLRARKAACLLRKSLDPKMVLSPDETRHFESLSADQRDILKRVALWLQHLAADESAPPLDCRELRGGIYRDDAWVRSPLQPTVLASTVDQVGSRLLFRGYGVPDRNLSIHAALTANDCLLILDEAHCSRPFGQTLAAVARYRSSRWAAEPVASPFAFVQMTATPQPEQKNRTLFPAEGKLDYALEPLLKHRHGCSKPVELVEASGAKGKSLPDKLAKQLVEQARELADKHGCQRVAIVTNRVTIARKAYQLLTDQLQKQKLKSPDDVSLMIGRMRPLDRDTLTKSLQQKFQSGSAESLERPQFVVATQCLEIGADFDFDGMVCQCASLDALRQRFGRLNRLGNSDHARGVIVAAEGDIPDIDKLNDDKPLDPIYGNSLARTWHWMLARSSDHILDFGIQSLDATLDGEDVEPLRAPSLDAPVLMPAHVDMLCQTSPRPTPEPDIPSYLHGPDRGVPELRVCWRADLDVHDADSQQTETVKNWIRTVAVCPPTSAECLSVPLHVFRKWLRGEDFHDETGDVLGERPEDDADGKPGQRVVPGRCGLVWRGIASQQSRTHNTDGTTHERSFLIRERHSDELRPNDTVVIPARCGGWSQFGHVPDAPADPAATQKEPGSRTGTDQAESDAGTRPLAAIDIADQTFAQSRGRTILRAHPGLVVEESARSAFELLLSLAADPDANLNPAIVRNQLNAILGDIRETTATDGDDSTVALSDDDTRACRRIDRLVEQGHQRGSRIVRYQDGIAWTTALHLDQATGIPPLPLESFGDEADALSETGQLSLRQHLADVYFEACRIASALSLPDLLQATMTTAAKYHDLGKADPRFQALLLNKPLNVAYMQPTLWAKSDSPGGGRRRSLLPEGFRHEMLSLDLLDRVQTDGCDEELLAHCVASHHGFARPFAPVCIDEEPLGFHLDEFGLPSVSREERESWNPAHRLDSGIAERFWNLNRRFGWWGLAWLETALRLADWTASANPRRGDQSALEFSPAASLPQRPCSAHQPLILTGIDGSNPLGFLAALGVFRVLGLVSEQTVRFAWQNHSGAWRPAIELTTGTSLTEDDLSELLFELLERSPTNHPATRMAALEVNRHDRFLQVAFAASPSNRDDADWLSCNGSDLTGPEVISQLQTTRRDYHAINIRGLLTETTIEHLARTLFKPWDYSDPIAGVSLHLEPREDRRHAYQWHTPSGDPTRKINGGMMGANRLALEAWPFFQSLPRGDRLATTGFHGLRVSNTRLTWPLWTTPIHATLIPSLLASPYLQKFPLSRHDLAAAGVIEACQCRRILVGKTPNLTAASPVLV